jgi:outer membrane protein TolC
MKTRLMRVALPMLAAAGALAAPLRAGELPAPAATPPPATQPPGADATAPVRWSLGDVMAEALAHNPKVGQADAQTRAAAARRGQVASVRLPQLSGAAGYTWAETHPAGLQTRDTLASVSGTLSQLITDFGRTSAQVASADELAAAAGQDARSSRVEVVFGAQIAYFNVLRADAELGVRNETVRQRESLLRQAQAFFDAGTRARIDVVRAEANLYQARADAAAAAHDLSTSRLLLLNAIGVDGPMDFQLAGAPEVLEAAGTLEDWQREADEKHPDLLSARLQMAAARSAMTAADRGANAVVSANGRLGWDGEDAPEERFWTVGAQIAVPIFNGHLTREQTAEAAAQVAASEFAYSERRRQIRLLVEQADRTMQDALVQEEARRKEREASTENLRLATGRYEAGAGDIIEMIDAQVQLATAASSLVAARFDRAVALAALYRALGRVPRTEP